MVTHTRQVLYTTAADQHHAVLLQVVAFTTDVGGHFVAVGQAHTAHLAKRGVRLLRGGGVYPGAYAATLRAALQGHRVTLFYFALARLAHQLIYSCHESNAPRLQILVTNLVTSSPASRVGDFRSAPAPSQAAPVRFLPCGSVFVRIAQLFGQTSLYFVHRRLLRRQCFLATAAAILMVRITGTRRDQAANDHVFLQATQVVFLASHCRLGKNAGG